MLEPAICLVVDELTAGPPCDVVDESSGGLVTGLVAVEVVVVVVVVVSVGIITSGLILH